MLDIFEKRPLAAFSSSFYVFACVLFSTEMITRTASLIISFFIFIGVLLFDRSLSRIGIKKAAVALSAGLLFASAFSSAVIDIGLSKTESTSLKNVVFTGTVQSVVNTSSYSGQYIVKPSEDSTVDGTGCLFLSENGELSVGDRIRCCADIHSVDCDSDYKYSLHADGVLLAADAVGEIELLDKSHDTDTSLAILRAKLSSRFASSMSEKSGGFAAALILGDRSALSDSVTRDFRCLGISHILALSGVHLVLIFSMFEKLLPEKKRFRAPRTFILISGILFYMALTGMSPSIVRSGIMLIIATASQLLGRKTDRFTSLSVAVLLICIASPYAPFDVGLQLSYMAVIGILASNRLHKKLCREKASALSRLISRALPAVIVPAFILPLSWLRFGAFSLISPLANLIITPVISLFIPVSFLLLASSYFPSLFDIIAPLADAVISFMLNGIGTVAGALDHILPLKGVSTAAALTAFIIFLFCTVISTKGYRFALGCASVVFLVISLTSAQIYSLKQHTDTTVYYYSVGSDDALCILSEGHSAILDIGKYPSAAKASAEHCICSGGAVDSYILTHFHKNHISAISAVFDSFHVGALWVPLPSDTYSEGIFSGILTTAQDHDVPLYCYSHEDALTLGDCTLTVHEPEDTDISIHSVIGLSLECREHRLEYSTGAAIFGEAVPPDIFIAGAHSPSHRNVMSESDLCVISPAVASEPYFLTDAYLITDSVMFTFGNSLSAHTLR